MKQSPLDDFDKRISTLLDELVSVASVFSDDDGFPFWDGAAVSFTVFHDSEKVRVLVYRVPVPEVTA